MQDDLRSRRPLKTQDEFFIWMSGLAVIWPNPGAPWASLALYGSNLDQKSAVLISTNPVKLLKRISDQISTGQRWSGSPQPH
jgi:hypothetical protein